MIRRERERERERESERERERESVCVCEGDCIKYWDTEEAPMLPHTW